jgi:predicted NBD/HSP70 family sugar kinase
VATDETTRPDPERPGLDGQLLTPSDIGDVNRSRVLQAFCDYGPLTRAELAKMAGVTRATIGNIVAGLLDSGLVEEGEPRETGTVGKPGRPLWFGPRAGLSGAVSLEPTGAHAALVNARGEVLAEQTKDYSASGSQDEIVDAVLDALEALMPKPVEGLLGIGVAVPGVCDTLTGRILGSGQLPSLGGTQLVEAIEKRFRVRVLIDNDSRAQALGEKWFGRGRQVPSFAAIQTGHGIGVGLVISGVVVRGPHGEAGEAGHTVVVLDGERCTCGLRGCWETIASLRWLRAEASRAKIKGATKLDAAKLVKLASDDGDARDLLERYADNIAVGLANLAQLLAPGLFILHGDAVGGGETFRGLVEHATRERVLGHIRERVAVVLSELDQNATVLGAAGLVLSETFHLAT